MNYESFEVRGEIFILLETAAECFRVELSWVEEIYATGLLGSAERVQDKVAIAATELDRLAAILRWRYCGLELEAVVEMYET